jgi:hypothetical protein
LSVYAAPYFRVRTLHITGSSLAAMVLAAFKIRRRKSHRFINSYQLFTVTHEIVLAEAVRIRVHQRRCCRDHRPGR